MSQYPFYQQGLAPQQYQQQQSYQQPQQQWQTPAPQIAQPQQVKFYKSGLFGFSSAAGRFQRDALHMQKEGWRLQFTAYLGMNAFLRRIIVATWVRA